MPSGTVSATLVPQSPKNSSPTQFYRVLSLESLLYDRFVLSLRLHSLIYNAIFPAQINSYDPCRFASRNVCNKHPSIRVPSINLISQIEERHIIFSVSQQGTQSCNGQKPTSILYHETWPGRDGWCLQDMMQRTPNKWIRRTNGTTAICYSAISRLLSFNIHRDWVPMKVIIEFSLCSIITIPVLE